MNPKETEVVWTGVDPVTVYGCGKFMPNEPRKGFSEEQIRLLEGVNDPKLVINKLKSEEVKDKKKGKE